ncbi:MAG: N-acetylmuramoyl-L-alanine amidase [Bacilli bacterium]|nr:N-acetylmuramoyl-L-alanine amidase [Bacilli bacterium]
MNKYKTKILLLFIFLLTIFNVVNASITPIPLLGKTIYLDAGHGGKDPGAYYKDIYEEDINLKIVLKLKNKLESMGATILLTRDDDYDLSDKNAYFRKRSDLGKRAKIINESNADIYLSIHLNSSIHSSWKGAQVFYDDINKKNKDIAEIFQKAFNKNLNSTKKIKEMTNLYMYKRINIPGVLLELGFISNPNERYLLNTDKYQDLIVDTLSKSLLEILL